MLRKGASALTQLANLPPLSVVMLYGHPCSDCSTSHPAPCLCPAKGVEDGPKPGAPTSVWKSWKKLPASDQFSSGCYGNFGSEPVDENLSVYPFLCKTVFPI